MQNSSQDHKNKKDHNKDSDDFEDDSDQILWYFATFYPSHPFPSSLLFSYFDMASLLFAPDFINDAFIWCLSQFNYNISPASMLSEHEKMKIVDSMIEKLDKILDC
jgi:hypothetical protein